MPDQAIHEMIAAYTSGCMDRYNFKQFKDYVNSGGKLPAGILGELQNLMALIPTILETENPRPELKNEIAKNLIRYQDEIKEKLARKKQVTTEKKVAASSKESEIKSEEYKLTPPDKTIFAPHAAPSTTLSRKDFLPSREEILGHTEEEKPTPEKTAESGRKTDAKPEPTRGKEPTVSSTTEGANISQPVAQPQPQINIEKALADYDPGFTKGNKFVLTISLIGIILIAVWLYMLNNSYDSHVTEFNKEISKLKSESSTAKNFIKQYGPLIEFFNFNDIVAYNLIGTDLAPNSSGKLLMSFEEGEGLLKVTNLFVPPGDQIYQLWMRSQGGYFSLLKFLPDVNKTFIRLDSFPYIPPENIREFRITAEPKKGSGTPTGKTYMIGEIKVKK